MTESAAGQGLGALQDEAYRRATDAAIARLVRHHFGLPDFTY